MQYEDACLGEASRLPDRCSVWKALQHLSGCAEHYLARSACNELQPLQILKGELSGLWDNGVFSRGGVPLKVRRWLHKRGNMVYTFIVVDALFAELVALRLCEAMRVRRGPWA